MIPHVCEAPSKLKHANGNSIPALEERAQVSQPMEVRDLNAAARSSRSTDILFHEEETLLRHVLTAVCVCCGGGLSL